MCVSAMHASLLISVPPLFFFFLFSFFFSLPPQQSRRKICLAWNEPLNPLLYLIELSLVCLGNSLHLVSLSLMPRSYVCSLVVIDVGEARGGGDREQSGQVGSTLAPLHCGMAGCSTH